MKTVNRKVRGFESCSLRHFIIQYSPQKYRNPLETAGFFMPLVQNWSSASPIRSIFREAFISAGLPYFNPHSFRNTLAQLGEEICKTPEDFKAWSQNLGHEKVLTTFISYGEVACQRQGEIIRNLSKSQGSVSTDADMIVEALFRKFNTSEIDFMRKSGHSGCEAPYCLNYIFSIYPSPRPPASSPHEWNAV